jgi:hypothetical protein
MGETMAHRNLAIAAVVMAAVLGGIKPGLAQNFPAGTKVTASYQGSFNNTEELTGTIEGKQLKMATTYYTNGSQVNMTVDGQLNGKTLSYEVKFVVAVFDTTCTATGTAEVDSGVVKIPLDQMSPDNRFCHQPANVSYRRNMTIQLPPSPS